MLLTKKLKPSLEIGRWCPCGDPWRFLVRPHSFVPVSLVWPNQLNGSGVDGSSEIETSIWEPSSSRTSERMCTSRARKVGRIDFESSSQSHLIYGRKSHQLIQIKDIYWSSLIKNECYLQDKNKKKLKPSLVIGRWCPCGDPWRFLVRPHSFVPVSLVWPNQMNGLGVGKG